MTYLFQNGLLRRQGAVVDAAHSITADGVSAFQLDLDDGSYQVIVVDAGVTSIEISGFTGAAWQVGMSLRLEIVQPSAGNCLVTWPTDIAWDGAASPTLSVAGDAVDSFEFNASTLGAGKQMVGSMTGSFAAPAAAGGGLVNGKSVALSGSSSYIDLENDLTGSLHDALDIAAKESSGAGMSIGCWFRRTSNATHEVLVSQMDDSSTGLLFFIDAGGEVHLQIYQGVGAAGYRMQIKSTNTYDDGIWHFALFVLNPSTNSRDLYVDGISDNSISTTGPASTPTAASVVQVGAYGTTANSSGTYNFAGDLDEISFWDMELSATDAARLYGASRPTDLNTDANATSLVSWYRMGDASGDTASDFYDASTAVAYTRNDSKLVSGATLNTAGASGIAHWWKLDDSATSPADSGPIGSTLVASSVPLLISEGLGAGLKDSMYFDGVGSPADYFSTAATTNMVAQIRSFSVWLNIYTMAGWDTFFNVHDGNGFVNGGFSLWSNNGSDLDFGVNKYNTSARAVGVATGGAGAAANWIHVVCVCDFPANFGQIYVDKVAGTAVSTTLLDPTLNAALTSAWITSTTLTIGAVRPSYTFACDSEMSDFRIYDRALTQADIDTIYGAGMGQW
jgi:hypothetical protein